MKHISLTVPELGLIAGTRAALGAGLALLLGDRLTPEQRRAVGWTLLAVGIVTTFPLMRKSWKKPNYRSADVVQSTTPSPVGKAARSHRADRHLLPTEARPSETAYGA